MTHEFPAWLNEWVDREETTDEFVDYMLDKYPDFAATARVLVDQHQLQRRRISRSSPHHLYRWYDAESTLLYVGISLNAYSRAATHMLYSSWTDTATRIEIERYPDRDSVEAAEKEAIRTENPVHNIAHKPK